MNVRETLNAKRCKNFRGRDIWNWARPIFPFRASPIRETAFPFRCVRSEVDSIQFFCHPLVRQSTFDRLKATIRVQGQLISRKQSLFLPNRLKLSLYKILNRIENTKERDNRALERLNREKTIQPDFSDLTYFVYFWLKLAELWILNSAVTE